MSFQCPHCTHSKSLRITSSIELAPDVRSDEISLQVVSCVDCNYKGLAVYEESSRGALNSESVDHYGYKADAKTIRSVQSLIRRCPNPRSARCSCPSHRKLNLADEFGRWVRPGMQSGQQTYPMRR